MSTPDLDTVNPFLQTIMLALIPHYEALGMAADKIPQEIAKTLKSTGARSRIEVLDAALALAFKLSALDMLRQARSPDMSATMRWRYRTCAGSLQRAAQQNSAALAKRLACDNPDAAQAKAAPLQHPADDLTDEQIATMIQQANAQINSIRNRLAGSSAPHAPQPKRRREGPLSHLFADAPPTDRTANAA